MKHPLLLTVFILISSALYAQKPGTTISTSPSVVEPVAKFLDQNAVDQDDMCIWVHPVEPAKSTLIASDKTAGKIFVYDLQGRTLQSIDTPKPGNIDVHYGFPLGNRAVDIVAFNQRTDGHRILVFAADPETRLLKRVDNGHIATTEGYGGTLYHSPKTGSFYFIKTVRDTGSIEQFELYDTGSGQIAGRRVRAWEMGTCEGAVADEVRGKIYIAEENRGIWEIGAEPNDPTPGNLVITVGEHNLAADVEGLAIARHSGHNFLIASNQSKSAFNVYRLGGSHDFVGTFTVRGARDTDGIEIVNRNLDNRFPGGLFVCHTDPKNTDQCPILAASWDSVYNALTLQNK